MIKNRFFIPLFLALAVTFSGLSFAFAPANINMYGLPSSTYTGMAAGGGGAGAVAGATSFFAGAGAFAVGMAVGYFGLDYILGDDSQQGTIRSPATSKVAAVPAPSAPSSSTVIAAHYGTPYGKMGTCTGATQQAACFASGSTTYLSYTQQCSLTIVQASVCGMSASYDGAIAPVGVTQDLIPASCSSGYSMVGGVCVLSSARQASPDQNCDLQRTGSALAILSDPDCPSASVMPQICSENGTTCLGTGVYTTVDGKKVPASYSQITTPEGGTVITTYKQETVGSQTQVTQTQVTVGSDGKVTQVSGSVVPGFLPPAPSPSVVPPASAPYVPPPSIAPVVNPVTMPSPAPTINFPNDYAKTGEASSAADKVVTKLDTITKPLTDTVATVDPVAPVASDMPTWGNTFTNLLAWQLPAHSSACPRPSMDLGMVLGAGHTFVLDSHCQLFDDHKGALQSVMMVIFSFMGLLIVLRA